MFVLNFKDLETLLLDSISQLTLGKSVTSYLALLRQFQELDPFYQRRFRCPAYDATNDVGSSQSQPSNIESEIDRNDNNNKISFISLLAQRRPEKLRRQIDSTASKFLGQIEPASVLGLLSLLAVSVKKLVNIWQLTEPEIYFKAFSSSLLETYGTLIFLSNFIQKPEFYNVYCAFVRRCFSSFINGMLQCTILRLKILFLLKSCLRPN